MVKLTENLLTEFINLCLKVSLGTVTNIEEAVKWLSYTYLFVRMRKNPLVYGIPGNCREVTTNYKLRLCLSQNLQTFQTRDVRFEQKLGQNGTKL